MDWLEILEGVTCANVRASQIHPSLKCALLYAAECSVRMVGRRGVMDVTSVVANQIQKVGIERIHNQWVTTS